MPNLADRAVGSLLPRIVHTLAFDDNGNGPAALVDRRVWITICVAALAPIAFLRTLHALRFTSYIALVAVVDLVFVIVFKVRRNIPPALTRQFFDRSDMEPPSQVDIFHPSSGLISSLPVYDTLPLTCRTLTSHSSPSPARRTCTQRTTS